ASALINDVRGERTTDEDSHTEFISRRKGGTRIESPTIPSTHPREGMFLGNGALGFVPRSCEVQARSSVNVFSENRMLTCEVRGIIWYLLLGSRIGTAIGDEEGDATSSCASDLRGPGSH